MLDRKRGARTDPGWQGEEHQRKDRRRPDEGASCALELASHSSMRAARRLTRGAAHQDGWTFLDVRPSHEIAKARPGVG
jgi:hypothetical protein